MSLNEDKQRVLTYCNHVKKCSAHSHVVCSKVAKTACIKYIKPILIEVYSHKNYYCKILAVGVEILCGSF